MSDEARRQLARRRLTQFERSLQAAAATMGEPAPEALATTALDLAAHAALAVALDPGLLHLIRINFFFDGERLPHWVESLLLLSPLCSEAEAQGLCVMDAAVRELLLARLMARHGQERLRAVAALLWQHAERRSSWFDRTELRHAQQLTALNFLAPERALAWLNAAETGGGTGNLSKEWFVAMRDAMPALPATPAAPQSGDPKAVVRALQSLDFSEQRAVHRAKLVGSRARVFILRGRSDHAHRWVLLRLLSQYDKAPALLWVVPTDRSSSLRALLARAAGLEPTRALLREYLTRLATGRTLAIAIDGVERLTASQQAELRELATLDFPVAVYLLDRGQPTATADQSLPSGLLSALRVTLLPSLSRITDEALREWIDRHGGELRLDGLSLEQMRDTDALATYIMQATDGVPERMLEHLCMRCGVTWPAVLAAAEAPYALMPPPESDAIAPLAREYERERASMPSGGPRTRVMTEITIRMREVLKQRADWPLQAWASGDSPGLRLAMAVALQLQPQAEWCAWLGTRIRQEKPFVAYHALLALLSAARQLPSEALREVETAANRAQFDMSPTDAHTDRADVLRSIRDVLSERRADSQTYLPLLPVRDVVLFPGRERQLLLTRPESMRGLFKVQNGGDATVFVVLDESQGDGFDPRRLRRIGTMAHVTDHASRGDGVDVTLTGFSRAVGTPTQIAGEDTTMLARIQPIEARHLSEPPSRAELVRALRALARTGGGGGRLAELAAVASTSSDCYRLSELIDAQVALQQSLLEADDVDAMVRLLIGATTARVREGLPTDLGVDGWGIEHLAEVLSAAFPGQALVELLDMRISSHTDDHRELIGALRSIASNGRLREIIALALVSRPDDEPLWEHVEAMTQKPGHPEAGHAPPPAPAPAAGTEPVKLRLWPNGSTLRIRFIGGSPTLRKRVMAAASLWLKHANLHYQVLGDRSKTPADIRIGFKSNDGSWSYQGTDARNVPPDEPTMNFGWLLELTPDWELRRVVLKEFGHALGLWQEHKNPNEGIEWNREAVFKNFTGPPNYWSREQVEQNILDRNPPTIPPYRKFDRHSVMTYDFPGEMIASGEPINAGSTLSDSDKAFIAQLYPRKPAAKPPVMQPQRAPVRKR
ncbi:LON peptidase substrate-binding domain-containing protein [Variovorax sp. KK3]|uniref:LON peptidase substrate-binding domain-containing protein n=1 Tax=Variovorax sp. KK3 TaxID=1855728 RepID=UPI00097C04AA|nr:LON peptidase substrate-binding domain-containing protein [Variovorax sp. KK3]